MAEHDRVQRGFLAAFVTEQRHRDRPPAVHRADDVVLGDARPVEEHLVELAPAGEHPDRSHLDAGRCPSGTTGTRCRGAWGRSDRCAPARRSSWRGSRTTSRSSARRSPTRRRRAWHACSGSRGRSPRSARRTPGTRCPPPRGCAGRNRRFCSSVPHFRSVLPTIFTVTVSLAGPSGTIARAHSSTSTTCSSLLMPPPPYSVGQARPSSPCSCRVRRQRVTNSAASSAGSAPIPGQSAGRCSARNPRTRARNASASGAGRRSTTAG